MENAGKIYKYDYDSPANRPGGSWQIPDPGSWGLCHHKSKAKAKKSYPPPQPSSDRITQSSIIAPLSVHAVHQISQPRAS